MPNEFYIKCGKCGSSSRENINLYIEVKRSKMLFIKTGKKAYVRITCDCGNSILIPTAMPKKGIAWK